MWKSRNEAVVQSFEALEKQLAPDHVIFLFPSVPSFYLGQVSRANIPHHPHQDVTVCLKHRAWEMVENFEEITGQLVKTVSPSSMKNSRRRGSGYS